MGRSNNRPRKRHQAVEAPVTGSRFPVLPVLMTGIIIAVFVCALVFSGRSVSEDKPVYQSANIDRKSGERTPDIDENVPETDQQIHERLFPTAGYRVYPTAKDVDWPLVLAGGGQWEPQREEILKMAVILTAEAAGRDDPAVKELLTIGRGSRIKGLIPMDMNIAIGAEKEKRIYIDLMWAPITQCIHIPRNRMGSLVQLASGLYHEAVHVGQIPDVEAAKKADGTRIEIEAYERQIQFNEKLLSYLEKKWGDKKSLPRLRRELRLVTEECQRRIQSYRVGMVPSFNLK